MHTNIWPLTIVYDRYNGVYSGAKWTAWPDYPDTIPEDINSDDVSCDSFWLHADKSSIGIGDTPEEAVRDLERKLYCK